MRNTKTPESIFVSRRQIEPTSTSERQDALLLSARRKLFWRKLYRRLNKHALFSLEGHICFSLRAFSRLDTAKSSVYESSKQPRRHAVQFLTDLRGEMPAAGYSDLRGTVVPREFVSRNSNASRLESFPKVSNIVPIRPTVRGKRSNRVIIEIPR